MCSAMTARLAASSLCFILGACGGGGGSGSSASPAAGLTPTPDTAATGQQPATSDPPAAPAVPPVATAEPPLPSSGSSPAPGETSAGRDEPVSGPTPALEPVSPPSSSPPPTAEQPPSAAPEPAPTPATPPAAPPTVEPAPPAEEPAPVFAAQLDDAPADRATLSGTVTLSISGSQIGNAELLPAEGYQPVTGRFTVNDARTQATFAFDTTVLPDSRLPALRISAFDQPAGSSSVAEIIVMPPRIWYIDNHADNSTCLTWATRNQLPDGRPALLDGSPATVRYCEPDSWTNGIPPADCECILYQN